MRAQKQLRAARSVANAWAVLRLVVRGTAPGGSALSLGGAGVARNRTADRAAFRHAASYTCQVGTRQRLHVDDAGKVGERLRAARLAAGLSQRRLAFAGCTGAYISRIEAGERVPSLQLIHEFARRLQVSPEFLATGSTSRDDGDAPLLQAEVALRLGDTEEAERVFLAYAEEGGAFQERALAGLGQLAFRAGRLEEAISHLEVVLELSGRQLLNDPSATESLARAYAGMGALESAVALLEEACEQARARNASFEVLRFGVLLANALLDRGQFERGSDLLVEAIRLAAQSRDPLTHARIYWAQSRFHILNGEPRLAAQYARRALDILERTESDNFSAMAYHLLAYAEVEAGEPAAALDHLHRGRELFVGSLTPHEDAKFAIEEARALLALRRLKAAAKAASHALESIEVLDPGDRGRSYLLLGDVFKATRDLDRARQLYELAIELLEAHGRPYLVDAASRLSQLLEELGQPREALQVLKRALRHQEPAAAGTHPAPATSS